MPNTGSPARMRLRSGFSGSVLASAGMIVSSFVARRLRRDAALSKRGASRRTMWLGATTWPATRSAGKLNYGSGGVGSANHRTTALFAAMAGIELTHVPYRGVSQAVNAIYSGDIDLIFGSSIEVLQHVQQGRARLLGVTTESRIAPLPDVPAIGEKVPG